MQLTAFKKHVTPTIHAAEEEIIFDNFYKNPAKLKRTASDFILPQKIHTRWQYVDVGTPR